MEPSEKNKTYPYTNHLIDETSPYLLQHAHNPVEWFPWGDAAFEKARVENKLVLISVGYAACHWCHVMEHESFEDTSVARVMNDHFVCIKVDREQRPDVDHQYMEAVQLLSGRGGWPLNCFALPDGKPVWGGTYFRKEQWLSVLQQLSDLYRTDSQKLKEQAEMLSEGIRKNNLISLPGKETTFNQADMEEALKSWESNFDNRWGGSMGAPKFPMPSNWLFLMDEYFRFQSDKLLKFITLSLDKMAMGGIYDQIGGGFARYATDSQWKVPHFEKMLYDNAQLLSVYSNAYRLTRKPLYKMVVYETHEFIQRDLQNPDGAFYASLDADSEGEEGAFYVWTKSEMDKLLGDDAPLFEAFYSVTLSGNWEHGKNVLVVEKTLSDFAKEHGVKEHELASQLTRDRQLLLEARGKREHPPTDTKVLTSWNALTITGLLDAYSAFGDEMFLDQALRTADFIVSHRLDAGGKLWRSKKNNREFIPAFLDDYAFTAGAFVGLYRATFDEKWLSLAQKLIDYTMLHFYSGDEGFFNYSELEQGSIILPKFEVSDNVIPSSNAEMAWVLYQLGNYFDEDDYLAVAKNMTRAIYPRMLHNMPYYSHWARLTNRYIFPQREVVIVGDHALDDNKQLARNYLPHLVSGSKTPSDLPLLQNRFVEGETLLYVCEDKTCNLPVTTVEKALTQLGVKAK